jgi:hypothetical protein
MPEVNPVTTIGEDVPEAVKRAVGVFRFAGAEGVDIAVTV